MSDQPAERIPKYKAPDFMRKEIELFLRARNETILIRRNGDDDLPIRGVMPISAIRSIRPTTETNHTIK